MRKTIGRNTSPIKIHLAKANKCLLDLCYATVQYFYVT